MRICQVIESTSGGSVQVALDLAKGLVKAGNQVTFIYSPLRADQIFRDQIAKMPDVQFICLTMHRSVGLHDLKTVAHLWQILYQEGPFDIIHAHSSKAGGLVRLLRPFLPSKTSLIYTPHAFVTMAPKASRLYVFIERLLGSLCDAIIAVSEGEKEHATQVLHLDARRVRIILNGIKTQEGHPPAIAREALGLSKDDVVVGFVGRFMAQKNLPRLIDVFAGVAKVFPLLRFVIFGGGEAQHEVATLLQEKGLEKQTRLMIDVRARPYMTAFDVLVCSSDYEGISLVFLEALAAGVPLVTTPVAGARETVVEGQTGFVAADFTSHALTEALLRYLRLSADEKTQLSQAAIALSDRFTLEHMIQQHRDLYAELVRKRAER